VSHVLRLRVRLQVESKCIETLALANSGFIGAEPEIMLPEPLARELLGNKPPTITVKRILADGSTINLVRCVEPVNVYVVTEDRVVGPVPAYPYISRISTVLLNDKLLGKLGIVLLDFGEGLWCFRDELGFKTRHSY